MGMVDFCVLGTIEVCLDGDSVDLGRAGAAKVRCLLAALLPSPGSVVPAELLVERVWGHQPPSSSLRYKYVAWLRSALRPVGVALDSHDNTYVLRVEPERVDVHRFQQLVGKSRAAVHNGHAADAADAAVAALSLWRGPALSGLSGMWARNYRDQLDRQRRDAVTIWARAALVLNENQAVVDELSHWHTEYPADETIAATLMLALHRIGQTGDALACFRATQQYIRTELGAEPSPNVTGVYHRIRCGDSAPNAVHPNRLTPGFTAGTPRPAERSFRPRQ